MDYSLGCPPDYFSEDGQAWGFAVVKPETLFDASDALGLGEGGKFLYQKYLTLFEDNPGGARIDHIIGLIDPFVYKDTPTSDSAGRLFSSPEHEELGKYALRTPEEYAAIMEKIVIPAAKAAGLESKDIICEDLGTVTEPTMQVMEMLKLRGIAVTEFVDPWSDNDIYRGANVPAEKIIMLGSHDNDTFIGWVDDVFKNKENLEKHAEMLSKDVLSKCTSDDEREAYKQKLMADKEAFRTAKMAELFTSPAEKVQIFFADFFGMKERYNLPGTVSDDNWSLRVPTYFTANYHKSLEDGRGLNMPEVLAKAIKQRGPEFREQNQELLDRLNGHSEFLKEKA
jgi:4-alpha-glucanotransferase